MATRGKGASAGSRASAKRATQGESVVPPTRQTAAGSTATGQALAQLRGDEEIPKGAERGSQVEIDEGDKIKPDLVDGGQPLTEGQKKPAIFLSNGQLESQTVPTNSGPIGVGAVATSPEDAKKRVEQVEKTQLDYIERRSRGREFTEQDIGGLGRAEVRAIGLQRGYDIPEAGTRATREAFLKAQEDDDLIQRAAAPRSGAAKKGAKKRAARKTSR